MNFSQVLFLNFGFVAFNNSKQCLKGWDLSVAIREPELNKALHKVVSRFLLSHTLPTFNYKEDPQLGGKWAERNSVKLQGLKISSLKLAAQPNKQHEGKLSVTFSAGYLHISQEIVFQTGGHISMGEETFTMKSKMIDFKVRVTAYSGKLKGRIGDSFTLMVEIVDEDAILGTLGWTIKNKNSTQAARKALSEKMKRELRLKKNINLGSFDLPKRDQKDTSLVKDLFPKRIRFAFSYDRYGNSVLAALATTSTSSSYEGSFNWGVNELIPKGKGAAIAISGAKMMRSLKPVIAKQLSIPDSSLQYKDSCPSKIYLRWRLNDVHGTTDLKSMELVMYGANEFQIKLKMFDHVSPGITVDIFITVRLRLAFNNGVKRFDVTKSYQNHSTKFYREWWVWVLEIVTLGIARIVTEIITYIANGVIRQGLVHALDFDPRKGGMPLNIGGVLGEVFDRMSVQSISWYDSNLMFPFDIKW